MLRNSVLRATTGSPASLLARRVVARNQGSYAISNVQLADIEKRWEGMLPAEQAELWMALRDRMKGNWKELTLQEKQACAYPHHYPLHPHPSSTLHDQSTVKRDNDMMRM